MKSLLTGLLAVMLLAPMGQGHAVEPRVINGTPNPSWSNAAVFIQTSLSGGGCTGVLVHAQLLATAAHCFVTPSGDRSIEEVRVFAPGTDVATSQPLAARATQLFVHPQYVRGAGLFAYDIAFLAFDSPVGTPVVRRIATDGEVRDMSAKGEALSFAGYGRTTPRWPPVLDAATGLYVDPPSPPRTLPNGLAAKIAPGYSNADQPLTVPYGSGGARGTCSGDSGGPWLRQVDGALHLVGVEAAGIGAPCVGTGTNGESKVAVIGAFPAFMKQVSSATGFPIPLQTRTCAKYESGKPECANTPVWKYDYCTATPRYRVEKFAAGKWTNVTSGQAKRSRSCFKRAPFRLTFTIEVPFGESRYRVVAPKQRGNSSATSEEVQITSS
jgi:hypothetical protein